MIAENVIQILTQINSYGIITMAIPDYQSIMKPLLELASDGKEHGKIDSVQALAPIFQLTDEEIQKTYPNRATTRIFEDRMLWAKSYLKHAGCVEYPRRGIFIITPRGQELLGTNPPEINNKVLNQYPEFHDFISRTRKKEDTEVETTDNRELTPSEQIREAHETLRNELADQLLETVKKTDPFFFEKLVVQLLVKMGYGRQGTDSGLVSTKTGDEGIDGIINEDPLGLEKIYLQAKRWTKDNPVGRPEIQKFVGALDGKKARKGVFLTTAKFTAEARTYTEQSNFSIVLIDGEELTRLMIDYNLGVSTSETFEVKRVDTDYFEGD